jgi:hypothetical protein
VCRLDNSSHESPSASYYDGRRTGQKVSTSSDGGTSSACAHVCPAPTAAPSAGKRTKWRTQKPIRHFSTDPLQHQHPCSPATHNDPRRPDQRKLPRFVLPGSSLTDRPLRVRSRGTYYPAKALGRTSADVGHTADRICSLTSRNAARAGSGRVTTGADRLSAGGGKLEVVSHLRGRDTGHQVPLAVGRSQVMDGRAGLIRLP